MIANKIGTMIAKPFPNALINGVYFELLTPIDWKADWNPCNKWKANTAIDNTYNMVKNNPDFGSLKNSTVILCKSLYASPTLMFTCELKISVRFSK